MEIKKNSRSLLQKEFDDNQKINPRLEEILDIEKIHNITGKLYSFIEIGITIIDREGKILVQSGRQKICSQFHRKNPESSRRCLMNDMQEIRGIPQGEFKLYNCKNNLREMVTPIIIKDEHLGDIFLGPFLLQDEEKERDVFFAQAEKYNFNSQAYLNALEKVPRFQRDKVEQIRHLFQELTDLIVEMGYKNYELKFTETLRAVKQQLEASEKRFRSLVESVDAILWEYNISSDNWDYLAPQVIDLLGYAPNKWSGLDFLFENIFPEDRQKVIEKIKQSLHQGKDCNLEYRFYKKNGDLIWIRDEINVETKNGQPIKMRGLMTDITKLKKAKEELRLKQFSVDKAFLLSFRLSPDGEILYANDRALERLNYSKEELLGKNVNMIIPDHEIRPREDYWSELKDFEQMFFESFMITAEGEEFPTQVNCHYFELNGQEYEVSFVRDITQQKEIQKEIEYEAFHDNLTGLYNRSFLEEEIERLNVERQLPVSILMADLNGLKLVNDTYGHERGDQMLKSTAKILRDSCRSEDLIARWGGDEFVILFPQTELNDARKIYDRIKDKCHLNQENCSENEVPISIALGLSVKTNPVENIHETLKRAEDRMYDNKRTESRSAKSNILETLLNTLGQKSNETRAHVKRLSSLAQKLGEKIDLPPEQLDRLSLLATLHDIGKTIISEDILTKKGLLTEEEWKEIEKHPETGNHIASSTEEFAHVADEILAHHEHWNGQGYPRGLSGEDIPLLARIISIVDAFDVMTHDRPYKEAISKQEALEELIYCKGTQFDPELVEKFIEII
ncbi:MAG: PocR ligand-binding domain-containing protein [bacterium]